MLGGIFVKTIWVLGLCGWFPEEVVVVGIGFFCEGLWGRGQRFEGAAIFVM